MRGRAVLAGSGCLFLLVALSLAGSPAWADPGKGRADRLCEKALAAERDAREAERKSEERQRFLKGRGGNAPGSRPASGGATAAVRQSVQARTAQAREMLSQLRQGAASATRDKGIVPGLSQYFTQMESGIGRMLQAIDSCLDNPGNCSIPQVACPPIPPMPSFNHSGSADFIRLTQKTYAEAANKTRKACLDLNGELRAEMERLKRESGAASPRGVSPDGEASERFGEVDLQLRRAESLRREALQLRREADRASGVSGYCGVRTGHRMSPGKNRAAVEALRSAGKRDRKDAPEISIEEKFVDLKAAWGQPWEKAARLEAPGVPLPKVSVLGNGGEVPAWTGDPEGQGGSWWRDKTKGGGTPFFGSGGGPGPGTALAPLEPENDPMVVDLRHLRQASGTVRAIETAPPDQVPALLEKALGEATGEISEPPAGTVAPAVDEQGLRAFRKARDEYAWARDALEKAEAALKEARARKQGGGPEADAAWEKARAAHDAARERAGGSREEAVRVLRALGAGKDPETFRPPVPSIPSLTEEKWLEMQKRMMAERAAYDARQERTLKELRSIVPPVKKAFEKVHEMVILGARTDNNTASRMMENGVSVFSNGKSYAEMNAAADRAKAEGREGVGGAVVVSFGTAREKQGIDYAWDESRRVGGDHLSDGAVSLSTPQARKALEQISGKECDRLVAHSNGASVAEALIREDLIRVNELNIVGGDASLAKKGTYQELVDSGKVKRVVVWVNVNDPVPWVTSAIAPYELTKSEFNEREALVRKLIGAPATGVEYRLMPAGGRKGDGIFAGHLLEEAYNPAIANWFGLDGYTIPTRGPDDK